MKNTEISYIFFSLFDISTPGSKSIYTLVDVLLLAHMVVYVHLLAGVYVQLRAGVYVQSGPGVEVYFLAGLFLVLEGRPCVIYYRRGYVIVDMPFRALVHVLNLPLVHVFNIPLLHVLKLALIVEVW